jgi:hypothetical protein
MGGFSKDGEPMSPLINVGNMTIFEFTFPSSILVPPNTSSGPINLFGLRWITASMTPSIDRVIDARVNGISANLASSVTVIPEGILFNPNPLLTQVTVPANVVAITVTFSTPPYPGTSIMNQIMYTEY